jgi:ADP-ribose pyrophosphatase YjhB (NUDIX family)
MIKTAFTIVKNEIGKIALIQEGGEQARGLWCLPGGHADGRETPEAAAIRETKEEAGLNIQLTQKILTLEMNGKEYLGYISENDKTIGISIFGARSSTDEIRKGDEELDVRWFTKDEIEKLDLRWDFLKELLTKS